MTEAKLYTMIAAAVAQALKEQGKKSASAKPVKRSQSKANLSSKEERKVQFEIAAVRAAEAAGFKNCKPNETLLTYAKWEAKGLRPKKGEKAIRVPTAKRGVTVPLFHVSQCEALAA